MFEKLYLVIITLECEPQSRVWIGQKLWSKMDCLLLECLYRTFRVKSDIIRNSFLADIRAIFNNNIVPGQPVLAKLVTG